MTRWIAAGLCLAVLIASEPAAASPPFDPFSSAAIAPKPGARLDLSLSVRDQTGATRSLAEIGSGLPIVFVPVQHRCPNICGVTLSALWDAFSKATPLSGQDAVVVAFEIDSNEGPAEAAAGLAALRERVEARALPGWTAVTASSAIIGRATAELGYRFSYDDEIRQYAHPAAFAVLAADGRLVRWFSTLEPDPAELGAAVQRAAQSKEPSVLEQAAVLLCYRYDPVTGRFTPSILAAFRIFGVGSALVALIALTLLHLGVRWGRAR